MNPHEWGWLRKLKELLSTRQPEPTRQAARIVAVQLNIVLPAKVGVIAVVLYYLFYSGWLYEAGTIRELAQRMLKGYFLIYIFCNLIGGGFFALRRRFPAGFYPWLVFTLGLLDGLLVCGLTAMTDGFDSLAYWMFPALIVLNAISIPLAMPQIVINLILCCLYVAAGALHIYLKEELPLLHVPGRSTPRAGAETNVPDGFVFTNIAPLPGRLSRSNSDAIQSELTNRQDGAERRRTGSLWPDDSLEPETIHSPTEPKMRLFVLVLLTACCYGVQVLAERQRRAFAEEREFAVREAQLRSAGRLAAEFTHQIKNPLAIINNAVYSAQRALRSGRNDIARQIQIIQEEVERSDRIVTQMMGYAQLTEGRVEKLNVAEELDRAIAEVFPAGMEPGIDVRREYGRDFPPLLMQKRHLTDSLVNLLQNAREALGGKGTVTVSAAWREDSSIEIAIADTGPGIPPDRLERIFEAYFTTKEKGTGLGLSIVKHNVELYTGRVRVESELGKGARFVLTFPAKTVMGLEK